MTIDESIAALIAGSPEIRNAIEQRVAKLEYEIAYRTEELNTHKELLRLLDERNTPTA